MLARADYSWQVSAGTLVFLAIVLLLYTYLSRRRGRIHKLSPKRNNWQFWNLRNKSYGQLSTHDRSHSLSATNIAYNSATPSDRAASEDESAARSAVEAGVDRNTSVRSVMTLPAYSQAPKESEQVIGREGERAGMDMVVEFPETVDEEELRRDDEMESLYQIRLARRRELAEREQRRQERREARERGDFDRLEELRMQSRLRADSANASATNDLSAAAMLAEHQSRGRDRRVSSVSYGELGQVRHDGSRLRANSEESERGGLLDGAAPMGEGQARNRAASGSSSFFSVFTRPHTHNRSTSSLSISTAASDVDTHQPPQTAAPSVRDRAGSSDGRRSRDRRRSSGDRRSPRRTETANNGTSESSPAIRRLTPEASSGSDDIGESHIPPPLGPVPPTVVQPPEYDSGWGDAPAYQSPAHERDTAAASTFRNDPVELPGNSTPSRREGPLKRIASKAPRLPQIQTLPSINVEGATEPNTPASPVRRPGNSAGP